MSTPDNPANDPNLHTHTAGEAAGRVIGGGVGVLLGFVLIVLMLGPILWAPIWAGLRVARFLPAGWQPWVAGIIATLVAFFAQFLLLVQKSPLLRYPIVSLLSLAWVGGLWLELTSVSHDWITTAPTLHAPGKLGWALIGLGAVLYAGIYLLSLSRFGKGQWARGWQLIK